MSTRKLKKIACEAFTLSSSSSYFSGPYFSGFVRACQVLGIEVYPMSEKCGVIVRTSRYYIERYRTINDLIVMNVCER